MSTPKVSLKKKSAHASHAHAAPRAGTVVDFVFVDNQDDTFTVTGADAAGNPVDISTVATLTPPPTSGNTAILTVGAPTGMTFLVTAVGPLGTAIPITATATWNDGSVGPFAFTLPCDVVAGAASSITIVPGTPTVQVVPTPTPAPAPPTS